MTKLMVFTGYIAYDTFEESYNYGENNPLGARKTRVFDVSDDTKMKAAYQQVLKTTYEDYEAADLEDYFRQVMPAEPVFKLADLKENPEKVAKLQEEYEQELAAWENSEIGIAGMLTATNLDAYTVESFEKLYTNLLPLLGEGVVPRVHIHDLVDPTTLAQ